MSKQHCRTLQVERFFPQCRMLLRHCCRFWQQCCRFRQQCRTKFRPFDNVETNWTCSICFDFVESTLNTIPSRTKTDNSLRRCKSLLVELSRLGVALIPNCAVSLSCISTQVVWPWVWSCNERRPKCWKPRGQLISSNWKIWMLIVYKICPSPNRTGYILNVYSILLPVLKLHLKLITSA